MFDVMVAPDGDGRAPARSDLLSRLFSRKAAAMLVRNTIVSCFVFGVSIAMLWVLVEFFGVRQVVAAGIGFVAANSLHYALGRSWIFRGTDRAVASGYVYFLATGGLGLAVTMGLYALLLHYTPIHYLVARILVSVIAGLVMFAFNALLNFRRL
ncbi:GtrA family protein [Sphingobium sp. Z007]|uniref:GtrA family protein n=1 Tax=Sphingobium sp. Z007 TaxID=627495 RepID=UPI000B4981C7|nr:GtrA family protein [Sphingobium sp. Z007]